MILCQNSNVTRDKVFGFRLNEQYNLTINSDYQCHEFLHAGRLNENNELRCCEFEHAEGKLFSTLN